MVEYMDSLNHDLYFDILKEIGNIGAGNAITALSKMIKGKVEMNVPEVKLIEFKQMAEILGTPEELIFGILVTLRGDINGMMMFLLKVGSAKSMIGSLLGDEFILNNDDFTELELSALQEIGNILCSSYLSALSTLTNTRILPSVPYMAKDMAGAILSVPAIEFGKVADKALFIESVFGTEYNPVSGYFMLVPDIPSFGVILKALGVE